MNDAKSILDKVKNLKSNSDSMALKKTKGTINGAIMGAAGGLLLGYTRKYNLVTSAFLGAVLGGIISQLLLPKVDEE
jgi:proteasome assembly chaperone (PAC2) family protein